MVSSSQNKSNQLPTDVWLLRSIDSEQSPPLTAKPDLQQQYDRQAAMADLQLAISRPHELPNLLARIVETVKQLLPVKDSSIVLWSSELARFVTSASTVPLQEPQETAAKVRVQSGATKWIIDNCQPVIIEDIAIDPFGANDMLYEYGYRAYCGVPLVAQSGAIGVLYALEAEVRRFSFDDVNYLITLANHVTVAVENVRLLHSLKEGLSLTEGLFTIAKASTDANISELASTICEVVAKVCVADHVIFSLWDSEIEQVTFNAQIGNSVNFRELIDSHDPRNGLFGLAIRLKQHVFSPRNVVDERHSPSLQKWRQDLGFGAILVVPLVHNDLVLGVITTINRAQSPDFNTDDINNLEKLTAQAASAVNNNLLLQKIKQQASALEQQVSERTAELQKANNQLQQAVQLKNKFLADISHELRTPVTSLSIYLDLLERGPTDKFDRYISTLIKEKNNLVNIVEKAIFMVELNAKIANESGSCEPNSVILDVHSYLGTAQGIAPSVIRKELKDNLPDISLPSTMFRQVILQLLYNALQFAGNDEIVIESGFDDASGYIAINVADKGSGIPDDELPYIFDRFYRGNAIGQYNITSGSGLGLSMVREIVTGYGGQVSVQSVVEEGTTFTLLLPIFEN